MLDNHVDMFKEQIAQLEKERDALAQENGEVKCEVEKLSQRNVEMDRQIDELVRRVETSEAQCRQAEQKCAQLTKEKGILIYMQSLTNTFHMNSESN